MVFRIIFFGMAAFFFFWGTSKAGAPPKDGIIGEEYRSRYALNNASQKLIDNNGKGFSGLYGTRNFRAVLNGVYYRGGANNLYFVPKRANSNPLPTKGLENLCKEGFGKAVYFYSTNFSSAPKSIKCRDFKGNENTIEYQQISPLHYRAEDLKTLLTMIYSHVRDPRLGPIYDHCWNGWHASGYVAALTLRQFCGFTGDQAVAYWNLNTDGNNKGASYDDLRSRLRAFVPYPGMALTSAERAELCPTPGNLSFSAGK